MIFLFPIGPLEVWTAASGVMTQIPKSGSLLHGEEIYRSGSLWRTQSANLLHGLAGLSDAVPSPRLALNNTNAAMHSINSVAQIHCIAMQQQS